MDTEFKRVVIAVELEDGTKGANAIGYAFTNEFTNTKQLLALYADGTAKVVSFPEELI